MKISFHCALILILVSTTRSPAQQPPLTPSYSGSMGSVTVGQEQFYRLSFRPDIPIGRWGIALDVELFLEANGDISARGWKFGSATETFDSALRKIYYLRYGRPADAVYFRIGALDQVTLGYGLIMADYRNSLQYPGIKKTGLQFRLENIASTGIGVEGVVNNFQDFQVGGALLGLRAFGRPGARPAGAAPPPRAAGLQKQNRQHRRITNALPGANQIQWSSM